MPGLLTVLVGRRACGKSFVARALEAHYAHLGQSCAHFALAPVDWAAVDASLLRYDNVLLECRRLPARARLPRNARILRFGSVGRTPEPPFLAQSALENSP
jgi:hypothetical protein